MKEPANPAVASPANGAPTRGDDNVIQLKYIELEGRLERGISVLKVRGVRHSTDVRRMSLEPGGIQIGSAFKGLRGVLTGLPVRSGSEDP